MGSYVNALGTIHSLIKTKINIPIILGSYQTEQFSIYSKYIKERFVFNNEKEFLFFVKKIKEKYKAYPVIFPTGTDYFTKLLLDNYYILNKIAHLPINPKTIRKIMEKEYQYQEAKRIGIPVPNSIWFHFKGC